MPHEKGAPQFLPDQLCTIGQFFEDLHELFACANVTNTSDQKKWAHRYAPVQVADLWEILPEYQDTTSSFADFKKCVLKLYPSSDNNMH